ncbi:signal peptidase I [Cryptosporangium phraense]|uniref:Signal peptidase I n=1 Tax=Cryptosporangium phraense TaxID=2593070 RepID=A0A545ANQ2_9ACTN|nr:signal peptidase I [Cryptosporangium phraense]TQS42365.1 signal peptidase I [Cryptosporangium phraense]
MTGWTTAARFAAIAYLSAMASLMCWAGVSLALGTRPALIVSGSMAPSIRPGDLVVVSPLDAREVRELPTGRIVIFTDPADRGRELAHRLVGRTADGRLRTKGDANPAPDSTPVPVTAVRGQARLVVPLIGRPFLWLRQGEFWLFAGWTALTLAAGYAVRTRPPTPTRAGAGPSSDT